MSDLPDIPEYPVPTTLIARSGIQFLDFALDPDRLTVREWGFLHTPGGGPPQQLEFDRERGEYLRRGEGGRHPADPNVMIGLRELFHTFLNRWLPLPLFQCRPDGSFLEGPADWARVRMVDLEERFGPGFRDRQGNRLRVTLAVDTALLPDQEGRSYLGPHNREITAGALFALAHRQEHNRWFLEQEWVGGWLEELMAEAYPRLGREELAQMRQCPHEEVARYLAFLDLLAQARIPPPCRLVADATGAGRTTVPVDLVLDVGNSRTCGMLCEVAEGGAVQLNDAYELALRDLTHPELVHTRPFESRVEFAQASFGKNHLSRLAGRTDAFVWPSLVRVGREARSLAARRRGSEGNSGMSSPKRYLWDEELQVHEWRFNTAFGAGRGEPAAASGPLAQLINQRGDPLHQLADDDPDNLPVFEPRYARSSLMTFALVEMLLQALGLMNSVAQRHRRSHAESPRRLRRVILTIPTGLPLAERTLLAQRARSAVELTWLVLGWPLGDPANPLPELLLEWDEASCTQMVYLYTEAARTFGGDARLFFDTTRKPGSPTRRPDQLRVASIDVGGGTTDMIVTTYTVHGQGTTVNITPRQEFREGIARAGDDILLRVIQHHVLPPIEEALGEAGVASPGDLTSEFLGGDRGGQDIRQRTLRQQFALQVAMPIALGMLRACEGYDPGAGTLEPPRPFHAFFDPAEFPSGEVMNYLAEAAAARGAQGFDLGKVLFPMDLPAMDKTVRVEMRGVLEPLCEAIHLYDCDLVLMSGRPSRLPALRALMRALLPLPPDRILFLHDYRVGSWYPFRDAHARIDDPKTTVAMGAMICALGRIQLQDFSFRSDLLKPMSTARYIGKLEAGGQILPRDLFYADVDLEDPEAELPQTPFEFRGPMAIGARQLPVSRWPAQRLYFLEYADSHAAETLSRLTPLRVSLARSRHRGGRNPDLERFRIRALTDHREMPVALDKLRLRLQTLDRRDGYWIDTGILKSS